MARFFLARLPRYPVVDDKVGKSLAPAVAAAASWLESMKLPLRKIYGEYTHSELAIAAWRSGETASNLYTPMPPPVDASAGVPGGPMGLLNDPLTAELEERLGPVAAKLDEDLDMRKLTGDEFLRFAGALRIPLMPGMTRQVASDEVSKAYRELR